jgi:hypothetical protein
MPFFTIIAVYYQGITKPETYQRFTQSLEEQTYGDFETLVYHDGPLLHEVISPYKICHTSTRYNQWGHNLRRIGLKQAQGKYILHTNVDNIYYPNALQDIFEKIQETSANIIITQVEMMGLNKKNGRMWYDNPRDYGKSEILTGNPPVYGNIDLMQAVIAKEIWDKYGWFNLIEQADGIIYSKICMENQYCNTDILIGRHY